MPRLYLGIVGGLLLVTLGTIAQATTQVSHDDMLSMSDNADPLSPAQKPNIVLIIADDLGWGDVGYNGSEIQTPHIDRLAAEGLRLARFYAQPSCTPTRASLMTGQAPIRIGVVRPFLQTSDAHLPLDLKILPEYLREAGYETALVGKWHLGHSSREVLPMARGFDHAYGYLTGGIGHYDHVSGGRLDWHRNEVTVREEGYATHLITDEAVRLIRQRDKTKPLFIYTSYSAPHLPNEAPAPTVGKYTGIEDENRRIYAAMVDEVDQGIGRILGALEQEGMKENTLVWFMSDNGGTHRKYSRGGISDIARFVEERLGNPAPTDLLEFIRSNSLDGGADNGPYKGGKGAVSEGGVLVPAIVYWPARLPSRPIDQRITVQDILPTLATIAGAKLKHDQPVDGADLSGFLRGDSVYQTVDFIVESRDKAAYYSDNWKLYRDPEAELALFDLEKDPYENRNIASDHPDIVNDLATKLDNFPRGEIVNISMFWFFLDPEAHGGTEHAEPWTDIID